MSTLSIHGVRTGTQPSGAILDWYQADHRTPPAAAARASTRSLQTIRRVLALFILLLIPLPNRARPATLHVPFRTAQAMILVEGRVNGNRATLLLDTGANRTIISAKTYGNDKLALPQYPRKPTGVGMTGYSLRRPADLVLGEREWLGQPVSVMDLEDLKGILKLDFDGLLGQDILRQFRTVRIDYRTHVLELEE